MINTILARYRITAKLGPGGMGVVYRVTDTKLDRELAIKVLPDSFIHDPQQLRGFEVAVAAIRRSILTSKAGWAAALAWFSVELRG